MSQPGEAEQNTVPSQPDGRAITFGLREAILVATGGIAVAVLAALYLS